MPGTLASPTVDLHGLEVCCLSQTWSSELTKGGHEDRLIELKAVTTFMQVVSPVVKLLHDA